MSTILFSHGKESGPHGTKIQILSDIAQENGFETHSLDYRSCANANERITMLREVLNNANPANTILVGSSMGGYVSTVLANEYQISGLFLMCPALYMPYAEYEIKNFSPKCAKIEIIHGWADETVPFQNSIRFGQDTKAVLNLVDDNHRLTNSHPLLKHRFRGFLGSLKGN